MKRWELVGWGGLWYAVGMELNRGNFDIVTWDRCRGDLLAAMEKHYPQFENKPCQERSYDVNKCIRTEWDGSQ